MTVIRSTIFFLGQLISIFVFLPVSLVSALLPPLAGNKLISQWAHFNRWWLRVSCGLDFEVTGLANLPATPSVILSKHQSAWETIIYQTFSAATLFCDQARTVVDPGVWLGACGSKSDFDQSF